MRLADMTWQEIDALDRSTVVVAPFGSMEQHGRHLPFRTDSLIAEEVSRRLDAARGGRLLVLPTQWLGLSPHHMDFSGTITASVDTFIQVACDIVCSLAEAGFKKFLVLNSHGGNSSILDVAMNRCWTRYKDLQLLPVTYWKVAAAGLRELRESAPGGMGHACELETSLVLAVRPDLVRLDKATPDGQWPVSKFFGTDMLQPGVVGMPRRFSEISKEGAVGDPRTASAEKGERFYDAIVSGLAELVADLESGALDRFRRVGE